MRFDCCFHLELPDGITIGLLVRIEEVDGVDDNIAVVVEDFFTVLVQPLLRDGHCLPIRHLKASREWFTILQRLN